jgi:hypothetical protein
MNFMKAQNRNNAVSADSSLTYMNTLSSVVNKAVKEGFTDSMKVTKHGLEDMTKNKTYLPQEVRVIDFFRFEGESDPADNSIMYKIETTDGAKGTLIDAYGPYSDENTNRFMAEVDHMCKRIANKDTNYH